MIQFRTKVSGCLLCAVLCLGLLAGCTGTEEPSVSEPGSETVSQLPEESSQPAETEAESGSDSEPGTPETVSVTGYLFDQQMILDEMNRSPGTVQPAFARGGALSPALGGSDADDAGAV